MNNQNPLVVKDGKTFKPAPEGLHDGICVDVVPLGLCPTPWGEKEKIRIVFELVESLMEDGRPFIVSNRYSPSLDDRSTLRKHLQTWRGKKFTEEELRGFDLEKLIGVCCKIMVQHSTNASGKTYANVEMILKATKKVEASGKYTRVKDRDPKDQKPQHRMVDTSKEGNQNHPKDMEDDDIAF